MEIAEQIDLGRFRSFWRWLCLTLQFRGSDIPFRKLSVREVAKGLTAKKAEIGRPAKAVSRKNYWKGRAWQSLALILSLLALTGVYLGALASIGFAIEFVRYIATSVAPRALLPLIAGIVFVGFAVRAARAGQLALHPTAQELLDLDDRPPVVLLRSFEDDDLKFEEEKVSLAGIVYSHDYPRAMKFAKGFAQFVNEVVRFELLPTDFGEWVQKDMSPFESRMEKHLREFGPVVAIGKPGEDREVRGASRDYLTDEDWKTHVRGWLEKARLIVAIGGQSEGLRWELEQILKEGFADKLVILLPPKKKRLPWKGVGYWLLGLVRLHDEQSRRQRWKAIADLPTLESLKPELRGLNPKNIVAVQFTESKEPVVIESRKHDEVSYARCLELAAYGILCHDWKKERMAANSR